MKLKIKIKKLYKDLPMPKVLDVGDWIDLYAAENVTIQHKGGSVYVSLGVAMQLPEGYEAIVAPRSSTPKKFGFTVPNSIGVIDNSYCSNDDIWKCPAYCIKNGGTTIHFGDRICQFRVQLSQKATVWQKIKWLFTSGIEFVEVQTLEGKTRGGFGSTGTK